MGGNSKTPQRTKNNLKPSNSGRSAALLQSTRQVPGFVGQTAEAEKNAIGLVLEQVLEGTTCEIDLQLQILFKKLTKKDPITKFKSLEELAILVENNECSTLEVILPVWSNLYVIITNDIDPRVRECAQVVLAAIVDSVGKNIAPFLKQIVPAWIVSQFDTCASAASISQKSFNKAFPKYRHSSVLAFCDVDIMKYVIKNISTDKHTTPNTLQPRESEHNERLVRSSLKAYSLLLGTEQKEILLEKKELHLELIRQFWNIIKSDSTIVKTAWYECLSALLLNIPVLLIEYTQRVVENVFQHLTEPHPDISIQIWSCAVLIQVSIKDWYKLVCIKDVLRDLILLMKNSGHTNSKNLYPYYFLFLSKLEQSLFEEVSLYEFYDEFLSVMKSYIKSSKKDFKKSENTYFHAFFECLQIVMQKIASNEDINNAIAYSGKLFENHIRDIIIWAVTTENEILQTKYTEFSNLILDWNEKKNKSVVYSKLFENFWAVMMYLIQEFEIENSNFKIKNFLELITRIDTFSKKQSTKKSSCEANEIDLRNTQEIHKELNKICVYLSRIILIKVIKHEDTGLLVNLKSLHQISNDDDFYKTIYLEEDLKSIVHIFQKYLAKQEVSDVLVDVVCDMLLCLNHELYVEPFGNILQVPNQNVQQRTLDRLLSHSLCKDPCIGVFLSQNFVTEIIFRVAQETVSENSSEKLDLLRKIFQGRKENVLVAKDTALIIVNIMLESLLKTQYGLLINDCANLIAEIIPIVCFENTMQREVFLKLFMFTINAQLKDALTDDTFKKIFECWQSTEPCREKVIDNVFISECSSFIFDKISDESFHFKKIASVAMIVHNFLNCSYNIETSDKSQNHKSIVLMKCLLNDEMTLTLNHMENYCAYFECLQDKHTPIKINSIRVPQTKSIISLLKICLFNIQLMNISKKMENSTSKAIHVVTKECISSTWSEGFNDLLLIAINTMLTASSIFKLDTNNNETTSAISEMKDSINAMLGNFSEANMSALEKQILMAADSESGPNTKMVVFFCDTVKHTRSTVFLKICDILSKYDVKDLTRVNILQRLLAVLPMEKIPLITEWFSSDLNLLIRVTTARAYIQNYFKLNIDDNLKKSIIEICINLLEEISEIQKSTDCYILCNKQVNEISFQSIITLAEIMKFITGVLQDFHTSLNIHHWDFIRVAMNSWISMISNVFINLESLSDTIVIDAVYKMHAVIFRLFHEEKKRSSSLLMSNIVEEWEKLFALESNLLLFVNFHSLLTKSGTSMVPHVFYDNICRQMEYLDFNSVINSCTNALYLNLDECIDFLLSFFCNITHNFRITVVTIFRKIMKRLIEIDKELAEKRSFQIEKHEEADDYLLLFKIYQYIKKHEETVDFYIENVSYKINELTELRSGDKEKMFGYLLLWDCAILAASLAPSELKSIYAQRITSHQLEDRFLRFLFRSMPMELLKNCDSKIVNNDIFKKLEWEHIKVFADNMSFERLVCHLYAQMLLHFPAVVRKWWNKTNSRQRIFVDKLTTNCVSSFICQEELQAISNKKNKIENMQIIVHSSTREVIAKYSIDDTKMELSIFLAANHPLGAAKIESNKQIGGRLQYRAVIRQLTMFLTHQNGSILDVLSLWKKSLDKKFEGIEECYVCYSVIHQDTCQLPKLACKTCRKRFHASCLYKWFTTSSKSTCPICRNVF